MGFRIKILDVARAKLRQVKLKVWQYALLSAVFIGLAFAGEYWHFYGNRMDGCVGRLQEKFLKYEAEMRSFLNDENLIDELMVGGFSEEKLALLEKKPYSLILLAKDTSTLEVKTLAWSNHLLQNANPNFTIENQIDDNFTPQKGSQVYTLERSFFKDGQMYSFQGLLPVYQEYPIKSEYFKDQMPVAPGLVNFVKITENANEYPIKNSKEKALFYVMAKPLGAFVPFLGFLVVLYVVGFILFMVGLNKAMSFLAKKWGFFPSVLSWLLLFSLFRFGLVWLQIPIFTEKLEIFNLGQQTNIGWRSSPGSFLVNNFLLLWLAVFIFNYLNLSRKSKISKALFFLFAIVLPPFLVLFTNLSIYNLIINSSTSLTLDSIVSMRLSSVVAMQGIGFLMYSVLLVCSKFYYLLKMDFPKWAFWLGFGLNICVLALLKLDPLFDTPYFLEIIIITILLVFTVFWLAGSELFRTLFWLMFFSGWAASVIYLNNQVKDENYRLRLAQDIANRKDDNFEMKFKQKERLLLSDNLAAGGAFSGITLKNLESRFNIEYFDQDFYSKYSYKFHLFTASGFPIGTDTIMLDSMLVYVKSNSEPTQSEYLYLVRDSLSNWKYTAVLPFFSQEDKTTLIRTAVIDFFPKPRLASDIYLDILTYKEQKENTALYSYNLALFKNQSQIYREGDVTLGMLPPEATNATPGVPVTFNHGNRKYLTIRSANGENVGAVGYKPESFWEKISLFSYIFCFLMAGTFIASYINSLFCFLPKSLLSLINSGKTLTSRIQTTIVVTIVASFVLVSFFSVYFFQNSVYERFKEQKFKDKVYSLQSVASDILPFYVNFENNADEKNAFVRFLAKNHNVAVNFFNLNGVRAISSNEDFYDRKLLSNYMHPAAYHKLAVKGESQHIQAEKVGTFSFESAYIPLKSGNRALGYLGIPFSTKESALSQKESLNFLVNSLNIYVILFLLAFAASLLVGNSIIRPLALISEKIKGYKFGQKNQPLDWDKDDEIGLLVRRFNEMTLKLEESTSQLAQSEKESAWREMAKQVAHEIKNPLTPMKLNLQLLQKASERNDEKAKEITRRVTKAMVEQIDGLAEIASAFSNFAKMPQAQNERMHLNSQVAKVFDLFQHEAGNTNLSLEMCEEDCYIYADKNQLTRVMNNLLKNADQAIPENKMGYIDVRLYHDNEMAIIVIHDNGTGIPEDKKSAIFTPNFTTKSSGTGIGLAICKNIVEAANGRIWFESSADNGTTFFVEVPLMKGAN